MHYLSLDYCGLPSLLKCFLKLMGNVATHKMGTHLIDPDIALKGKLIHHTDNMDPPAQGKL